MAPRSLRSTPRAGAVRACGVVIAVALAPPTHADEGPNTKNAGARRCQVGPEILWRKLPPDHDYDLRAELTLTPAGGLAILAVGDKSLIAQPLGPDGRPRGEAKPLPWPSAFFGRVTAAGGRFLVLDDDCANDRFQCITAQWLHPDGTPAGERRELEVGERKLAYQAYPVGDRVRVLVLRTRVDRLPTDLWLDVGYGTGGKVDVASHEIDVDGSDYTRFQDEPDGPWLIDAIVSKRGPLVTSRARFANADGTAGAITGWPTTAGLATTAPGRRLLVWADADRMDEWIDYRLELDGRLTELRRGPRAREWPAPFQTGVHAVEEAQRGIVMSRSFADRDPPPPSRLSNTIFPSPGPVVWSAGRFFALYAEREKRGVLIKLRVLTCR